MLGISYTTSLEFLTVVSTSLTVLSTSLTVVSTSLNVVSTSLSYFLEYK
jgi:hypothetical protein